jgi:hypothetical protein
MTRRNKLLAGLVVAAGSVAGAVYVRQQLQTVHERAGFYFADGTLLELGPEDAAAEELLKQGRELLARANPEES